jgi:nitrite reductase/ring-hydroxylating ferredoxin subunit
VSRPAPGTPLCHLDDIADPGAKGFVFGGGAERWEMFVVRRGALVRAYENACPHQGTPLEMFADRFLTADRSLILCTTHGARFRIEDGHCVAGPCKGDHLRPVALRIDDTGALAVGET